MIRNWTPIYLCGILIGNIDKTYTDEIAVKLPCGYMQRFFENYNNAEAIAMCYKMKEDKIPSA